MGVYLTVETHTNNIHLYTARKSRLVHALKKTIQRTLNTGYLPGREGKGQTFLVYFVPFCDV